MCGDPGCQGLRECSHRQRRRTLHQGLGRVWAFPKVRGCSCTNILPFGNGNHSTDANRERKKYADAQKIYLRALEVLPACEVGPTVSSPRYMPSYDQDSSPVVTITGTPACHHLVRIPCGRTRERPHQHPNRGGSQIRLVSSRRRVPIA